MEMQKHINTDYYINGWMICVIPHIPEDVFNNFNGNHKPQVKTVIKTFFYFLSYDQLHDTLNTFWSEYTNSNNENNLFDSDEFIWRIVESYTLVVVASQWIRRIGLGRIGCCIVTTLTQSSIMLSDTLWSNITSEFAHLR